MTDKGHPLILEGRREEQRNSQAAREIGDASHERSELVSFPRGARTLRTTRRLVSGALLVIATAIALLPIYWMLVLSLTPLGQSRGPNIGLVPETITLANFVEVLTERPLLRWVANSATIGLVAATAACVVGITAGYAISRYRFRGSGLIAIAILATEMIPQTSVVLPMYAIFSGLGLLNSQISVVLAHMSTVIPLVLWLSKGFFDEVPIEMEEAAAIDGAGPFQTFRLVALPLILAGALACFVYAFIVSWSDLIFARTLSSTPSQWTVPVGLSSFSGEFYTSFEPMMAVSIVFAAPIVLLFLVVQRHFVQGLTSGGVKG